MCDCPEDFTRKLAPGDKWTTTLVNEGNESLMLAGQGGRRYRFEPNEPVAVMNWDLAPIMLRYNDLAIVEILRG